MRGSRESVARRVVLRDVTLIRLNDWAYISLLELFAYEKITNLERVLNLETSQTSI